MQPCPPGPSSGSVQFVESVVPRLFCVRGIFLGESAAPSKSAIRFAAVVFWQPNAFKPGLG
jgi:hypothetical protein